LSSTQLRADASDSARGSEYAQLSRAVKRAGLLARRPGAYAVKLALTGAAFVGSWVLFFAIGETWGQLFTAVLVAITSTQVAFLAHDAGHRQIFPTRRTNDLVGFVAADLLLGISYGWWIGKHTRHHANPNNVDRDPDVQIGAVAFTQEQAGAKRGIYRFLAKFQAYLFFPLLLLEAGQLHAASIKALLRGDLRYRVMEGVLLLAHVAGYVTLLLLVLTPLQAFVFAVVHQGLFGLYLGCSFAPNHKGMPVLTEAQERDYLRRQVLTSRNVRGGWLVDLALGGLNYQIEHHLFPSMPRPSLRRAKPLIEAFCREHGVAYAETGLFRSYAAALRHLHRVGEPLRFGPVSVE
jgi:fatty acid desaturase